MISAKLSNAASLAVAALILVCGSAQAQPLFVPAFEAVGPPATSRPGDGLNAFWYSDPANPGQVYGSIAGAMSYMALMPPEGTFTATLLWWNGGDTTDINDFLDAEFGHDSNTLMPPVKQPIRSSIIDLTGFLNITSADLDATFAINSDDGAALYVGMPGTYDYPVILNDYIHAPLQKQQEVQFEAPGLYPIEIIYFNQDYNGGGGAEFQLLSTLDYGGIVSANRLYTKVTP